MAFARFTFIHHHVKGNKKLMNDRTAHTIQLYGILVTAVVLIIFAHTWLAPDLVFTSMIAGLSGIIGSRIASNGYRSGGESEKKSA